MAHSNQLAWVLTDFARTMLTDFSIERILDHLVARIVEILPISAAGVTLIVEGAPPRYIAASDDSALRYEQLQSDVREGPCLLASQTGLRVTVPDLTVEERFPQFASAALGAGLAAVFAFPLRHRQGRLGALDLYRDSPGALSEDDLEAAQTLADVAAAYLINAEAREEAQQTTDKLTRIAQHDALTGLPNRQLLEHRLDHAADRARRSHTAACVLFADLDEFKHVNDLYGHHVGDELLIAVAGRLSGLLRDGDTLSRVSGDEFVLLCEDMDDEDSAERVATRITEAFGEPFQLDDHELSVTASVGVAYSGPGEVVSAQLVVDADLAMYEAKRGGGAGHRIVKQRQAHREDQRHNVERDLRRALSHDSLAIGYQPIVRTKDGLVTGVEALLRWTDEQRGAVPAALAIRTAERSGLINEVGRWVLEHSVRDLARWTSTPSAAPLEMSVNVSARQLLSHTFTETVAGVLATTGIDPAALVLEVTENILIEDDGRALSILADLKALGVRLALDDFGTGFSSLSYLRRLPVDIVKIDRTFVTDLGSGKGNSAILEAVTHMAHDLGFVVVAEGVETRLQRDAVAGIGCDSSQGFYYSAAVPAAALTTQLAARPSGQLHLPDPC